MTRIAVAGQALIKEPVAPDSAAGEALVDLLSAADLAISNFEGTLADDGAVPTKSGVVHAADPSTPAGLKALGVSAVTVANNHLYDFGASGVLASLSAIAGAGLLAAGAGADLDAAAAPAFTQAGGLRLTLIGADCGPQADVVYAAARHAGINPLRVRRLLTVPAADAQRLRAIVEASGYPLWRRNRTAVGMPVPKTGAADDFFGLAVAAGERVAYGGQVDAADLERLTAAIGAARRQAGLVVVVLHNHHWEPDWADTPEWLRGLARQLVAAGAGMIACHGAPLLGGMEIVDGAPVYYGLGNLVFHCRPARAVRYAAAGLDVWSSVVATHCFSADGSLLAIDVAPIHAGAPAANPADGPAWTAPSLLTGAASGALLERFLARSRLAGWSATVAGGHAILAPPAPSLLYNKNSV